MSDQDTHDTPLRVRPYLLTGGRTRSSVDLALEAQILLTPKGRAASSLCCRSSWASAKE